jgi:hypothetical protein
MKHTMKNALAVILVSFAVLAAAQNTSTQQPLDWQGIYPGMTKAQVSTHLPKTYDLRCSPEDAERCVAASTDIQNPLDAVMDQAELQFYKGQLASIAVDFPQVYFEATIEKVQQKFAGVKPRIEQTAYRNEFGAVSTAPVYMWSRGGTVLTAIMIVDKTRDDNIFAKSSLLYSRPDLVAAHIREMSKPQLAR